MVHGIQKSEKQQVNNSANIDKKPPPVIVHHQPEIPIYPVATVMTELQFPPSPYHLAATHSPMMQQSSHSPMMQHSPAVDHNHSPTVRPPPVASFLSVASPFSNPPSPMAYSPAANVHFPQGGGTCHIYPSPQEAIPSRPPPDYPGSYYGMTATTYSHDQI